MTVDSTHYNAWWGLGSIAQKQEKYSEAHHHFKSAIDINQRSAILWTYLGITLHNCGQTVAALQCFEKAEQLDPKIPLPRYQKATVLLTLERYEDSLAVLKELELLVPKEAPIQIMIGKIFKALGKKDLALRAFNKALDLDQKDTNMVKSLIDKLDQNQEMHDESDLQL